jgi:hypothetical protein
MSRLRFALVQLMLCTNISESFTDSQISAKPTPLNILYLTDRPLTEKEKTLLTQFERTLSNDVILNKTVQLTTKLLLRNATTLDTLRVLDKCVRWKKTAIVISNFENENIQKTLLYGYTGLMFDIKTRPRNMQEVYNENYTVK